MNVFSLESEDSLPLAIHAGKCMMGEPMNKPPSKDNPFASLNMPDLPPGPALPVVDPSSPKTMWKMGKVKLQRETAHRSGKTVIVIKDFATHLPVSVIETIAKKVRSACGCGGTVKDKRVEIQGDNVARIRTVLEAEGFEVGGVK
ncbi:MAG: translation initiation factor Sui1 [Verrucomicrobiaceae bacterium]|nr:translation initiation factor Sui1 [Verrucomicrobiaceae bacterium]